MKRALKKNSSIYEHMEPYLQSGSSDKVLAQVRKDFVRKYKAAWRKQKRAKEKEITSSWTKNELVILNDVAKQHKLSRPKILKLIFFAYLDKNYIVPDELQVRKILQLLAMSYNCIKEIIDEKELHLQTGKIILEKIFELEREVRIAIYSPKTLEQLIREAISNNQSTKEKLYTLLTTI
jgi:hypothetical protein